MLNKLLTLALAAISTEAAKLHAHESTGVRGSTCTDNSDCGDYLFCLEAQGICVEDEYANWFNNLWRGLAQVDHPIAGGEGTGTPQEALPELSVELVADNGLAQIEAVYKNEGESCTKPNERCTLYTSCVNGVCCDDWFGCMSLAQVDHPIAGGEGTGTPQEALPELSVELVSDDDLAQGEAASKRETMPFDPAWHLFNAQVEAEAQTNAEWRRGPNTHTNTCDYSFACLFQRKCKPCPE